MPVASDMTGRAALVTGAAGGVGRATALRLGRVGMDICLVDIDTAGLDRTASALQDLGVRAYVHAGDLSNRAFCVSAVEAAVAAFGRLDALCNVAGVLRPSHTATMQAANWDLTLAVNLSAPFHLIQAAIPHLLTANGAVVNVASAVGITAQAYTAAYCATKAGLIHMTKSLAMEFMHRPIRFNVVAPGGMDTGMTETVQFPPGAERTLLQRVAPLRGNVPVEDVAEMVAFLCSDAASAYHGACITIDKGLTAG